MDRPEELSRLAQKVSQRIEDLKGIKSQRDIAREAGYKNQNMITMIKQGHAKAALDKVPTLGRALEVDPKEFVLLALEQFYSKDVINQLMADLGVKIEK